MVSRLVVHVQLGGGALARIHELLRQLRATGTANAALADDIEREIDVLSDRRAFGLNFERHTPEVVELPGRSVRTGDKVRVLPPRGQMPTKANARMWRVVEIEGKGDARAATLEPYPMVQDAAPATASVADLVVIAEFRDPIYPGLVSTGRVVRGGDKPFHTVINGENFHALQTLLFTHRGNVDAIYIDPPYNTGAKDWKYNNDYVEGDDLYRHSKWLAFMERRLLLAKELLNPEDSVLIVTIDEKEYLRLGLLLEQLFPAASIQMVSNVINRAGSPRAGRFSRVDEYIYYVFNGSAEVAPWTQTMLSDGSEIAAGKMPTVWFTAVRRGSGASRSDSKSLFYPVIIDSASGTFVRVGDPVPKDVDRNSVPLASGELAIWPLGAEGQENRWRFSADLMRKYFAEGTARLGRRDPISGLRPVTYLQPGTLANIANGVFIVTGRTPEGALELGLAEGGAKSVAPRTVWSQTSHFARDHGSHLIGTLLGNKRFDFPKSLYAVEDTLRFVVGRKPDAIVVDFFAGSGTTAHAVVRLNKQDGGRRVSISVTNNEVSADEQRRLRASGLRPGDGEWEQWGICEYVTKPRVAAAISGVTPSGDPIKGDYAFTDVFPMADGFEENVEFLTLTYEAPLRLRANRDFEKVAPLLWLRAGSQGGRIESLTDGWAVTEAYGVIADLDRTDAFLEALGATPNVTVAFVITDDDGLFEAVVSELPDGVEPVRLYDAYLRTFEIDAMRGVR